jgi:hypothetical protein
MYYQSDKISNKQHEGFEDFMAVTMKHTFFWDFMPCDSYNNRHFGGK